METADIIEIGGNNDGLLEGDFGDAYRPTIQSGGAIITNHPLTKNRLINHAEQGLPFVAQADECDVKRNAREEGFGAINRIEHPAELSVDVLRPKFFAQDAVRRIGFLNRRTHLAFGFLIGDGHGCAVGLDFDVGIDARMGRDQDSAGEVGEGFGEGLEFGLARFREHA